MASTLYICYFGVREPLVQTQVIPYLREIGKGGTAVSLLTFEPEPLGRWEPGEHDRIIRDLSDNGIAWHLLRYHKRPSVPATAYDVIRGTVRVARLVRREKFDVLHGRVHLPTLMGALARKFSRHKPKLLFDIRGFFPEEYTDAGVWPEGGWLYRAAKRVERWLMKESDGFVVLTENARDILFPESRNTGIDKQGRPVEVIPCCVDLENRFSGDPSELRAQFREQLGISGRKVILHLGALGGLYLTDVIAEFLAAAKRADEKAFGLFLTQSDPNSIVLKLQELGFERSDFLVTKVAASEIQGYLEASDIALSIVKAGFATRSRSPTKIPEYLICGLPIVANRGVGDVDDLIEKNKVGVLLDGFTAASYLKALDEISRLGDISGKCRETARREFDLENVGGKRYRRLYERLTAR